MSIDILQSGFRPGRTAYILAPGPNGKPHWPEIPDNAFVIAVNQAIEIPGINKSIWLCADGTLPEKEWFRRNAAELLKAGNPLKDVALPTPVFSEGVLLDTYQEVPYYFRHGRSLARPPWGCNPGVLRGGATIAAQAMQLAFHLEVKNIILCGVDMKGQHYYDGAETDNAQTPRGREEWLASHWLNILIWWMVNRKVKVKSLSPTALGLRA